MTDMYTGKSDQQIKKDMANFQYNSTNANQFMEETYQSNQALLHQMDSSCIDLENEGGSLAEVLGKHQNHYEQNEMQELEQINQNAKV